MSGGANPALASRLPLPGGETEAPRLALCAEGVVKTHRHKGRGRLCVLDGIDLRVREQEFLTLVGPSGCGKSTLLSLLAGLAAPDSGSITAHGRGGTTPCLGLISQTDTLLPWRTIRTNVEIGLELRGVSTSERRETAERLMAQVGLAGFENSYPFELSGGMRKRAAVIRTLAYDPDIILMDEPFVGLDVQTRDALEEDILSLWQQHRKTIVLVTHDLAEAITLSDRVVLLTARPATIKAEYEIPLPRPRSVVETKFTERFVQLHKTIWRDLSAEVLKASRSVPHDEA